MSLEDSAMTRDVLREIGKHPVDVTSLQVHVGHGVVYLRGRVERLRGYYEDLDLEEELNLIIRCVRQRPGIRDVIVDIQCAGPTLREQMSPHPKRQDKRTV